MFGRSKQSLTTSPSPIPDYQAEIARLEQRLADLLAETELLARVHFLEWKVRKAEERKAWLSHGVSFPQSQHDRQQDEIFGAMEAKMKWEEQEALKRIEAQDREERRRIESQNQNQRWIEESAERKAQEALVAQRRHELELQRIEAQKVIAVTISQALRADLS